jgi:hypothetical protein
MQRHYSNVFRTIAAHAPQADEDLKIAHPIKREKRKTLW